MVTYVHTIFYEWRALSCRKPTERRVAAGKISATLARHQYLKSLLPFQFRFLLHTYLVAAASIIDGVGYEQNPALHIAAVILVELPSGISVAEFLIATPCGASFSSLSSLYAIL